MIPGGPQEAVWLQGGQREHRPVPETPDGGGADLKGARRDPGEEDKLYHPSGHPCPPLPRVPRTAPRVGHRARVRGHEGSAGLLPCLGTSRANPSLPRELLLEGRRLTRCLALPARVTQWTDLLHRAPHGQAHARSLHASPAPARGQGSSRSKVRGDTPPRTGAAMARRSPAASELFILAVPAPSPPCY